MKKVFYILILTLSISISCNDSITDELGPISSVIDSLQENDMETIKISVANTFFIYCYL